MHTHSGANFHAEDAIKRAESLDPELRRLRMAVDRAGHQLTSATTVNRTQMHLAYRSSMRELLNYLILMEGREA